MLQRDEGRSERDEKWKDAGEKFKWSGYEENQKERAKKWGGEEKIKNKIRERFEDIAKKNGEEMKKIKNQIRDIVMFSNSFLVNFFKKSPSLKVG